MQQQDLPAAAAAAAAAATSCRSNKQTPTSRSAVYPALLGTRCNQCHHNEKIALIFFVVLFVRDQAEQQQMTLKKNRQSTCSKLSPAGMYTAAPCQRLTQTDLASCRLRIFITTRPAAPSQLHRDQGKVQPGLRRRSGEDQDLGGEGTRACSSACSRACSSSPCSSSTCSSATCRISTEYAATLLTFTATTTCSRLNLGRFCGAETTQPA